MRIAVTALSVVLMIVGVIHGQIGAQALDPQSLMGEWTGKWVRELPGVIQGRKAATNGAYRLIINKIEGQTVSAKVYAEDAQGASERDVRGRLEGSTLTFGVTRLTVNGKDMRGNRSGPFPAEITLTKRQ